MAPPLPSAAEGHPSPQAAFPLFIWVVQAAEGGAPLGWSLSPTPPRPPTGLSPTPGSTLPTHREAGMGAARNPARNPSLPRPGRSRLSFPTGQGTGGWGGQSPGTGEPQLYERAGSGQGGTCRTLTPRELLQRLLECGEPLRSRDTCFLTSAATVLRGQEGAVGTGERGQRGPENLGFGVREFIVREESRLRRENNRPLGQENLGFQTPTSHTAALPTPSPSTDGATAPGQGHEGVIDPSSSNPHPQHASALVSAFSSGGPLSSLGPLKHLTVQPSSMWAPSCAC